MSRYILASLLLMCFPFVAYAACIKCEVRSGEGVLTLARGEEEGSVEAQLRQPTPVGGEMATLHGVLREETRIFIDGNEVSEKQLPIGSKMKGEGVFCYEDIEEGGLSAWFLLLELHADKK